MIGALRMVSAPAAEPLTLEEARLHLRLDATGSPATHPEDALVTALISAARHMAEHACYGRKFITQTWDYVLDTFPAGAILLPIGPVQSISFVKYVDANGDEQTLSSALYQSDLIGAPARVLPVLGETWPVTRQDTLNTVTVRVVVGYPGDGGSPEDLRANVPWDIKAALLLILGHLYENRREVVQGTTVTPLPLPWSAAAMLAPYRLPMV